MALTPKNELSREEKRAKQENAQQEALLREVDEACLLYTSPSPRD